MPYLKKCRFIKDEIIFEQDEKVNGCYLLRKGEIEIVRKITLNPPITDCY